MNRGGIGRLSLALLAAAVCGDRAHAQGAAPIYKGSTITIVVGGSPGGGYDTYARLLGHYLGRHLPGEPNVVVANMPGAGSDVAAAYAARVAPRDGTYIAAPTSSEPLDSILENASELNFDPSRVNYLGTATSDDYVCFVRSDAPATFDDVFKTQVIMGGTAKGDQSGYLPTMLDNVLGTKFKVVLGYPGTREIVVAVQRGEIQGMCGMGWQILKSQYANLLANGTIKILVQESDKGLPEITKMGVPLAVSYAHNEQQRGILQIIYSQEVFARPYFVAAEVPADRVRLLRRAIMETWRDPDLLEDAAKMNLDVEPTSGEDIQSLLQKIYASPPALIQSAKEAIKPK